MIAHAIKQLGKAVDAACSSVRSEAGPDSSPLDINRSNAEALKRDYPCSLLQLTDGTYRVSPAKAAFQMPSDESLGPQFMVSKGHELRGPSEKVDTASIDKIVCGTLLSELDRAATNYRPPSR